MEKISRPGSRRLRDEIRKVIGSEDTVFGKLRGLLESFREIIPDEKQRYLAALKALSTTSKLGPQEIVKAVNSQLEELKVLEKGLMPTIPGRRDELKAMEARSVELKGEIARLRERIAELESEEKTVLSGIAAREKELELAEKTMKDLFADIGAEITSVKKKVEELTDEAPAPQAIPQSAPLKNDIPGEKKGGGEKKSESRDLLRRRIRNFREDAPCAGGDSTCLSLRKSGSAIPAHMKNQKDEELDHSEEAK